MSKTKEKGTILEHHPDHFKVELENGDTINARQSGKIRRNKIKLLIGDKVEVEVGPYRENGRIIYRRT